MKSCNSWTTQMRTRKLPSMITLLPLHLHSLTLMPTTTTTCCWYAETLTRTHARTKFYCVTSRDKSRARQEAPDLWRARVSTWRKNIKGGARGRERATTNKLEVADCGWQQILVVVVVVVFGLEPSRSADEVGELRRRLISGGATWWRSVDAGVHKPLTWLLCEFN